MRFAFAVRALTFGVSKPLPASQGLTALLLAICVFAFPFTADAFGFGSGSGTEVELNKNPLNARARFQPSAIEVGGMGEILIDLELDEGYHAYLDRFKLTVESPADLKLDDFKISPVVQFKDVVTKSMKDGVKGTARMRAGFEVPEGYKPGSYDASLKLVYQACTKEFCLFPKTLELRAPIRVTSGPPAILSAASREAPATSAPVQQGSALDQFMEVLKKGTLPAVLLMFVAGFLTSLTPCVYPMIPITLAVLGVRAPVNGKKPSHLRSFSIAMVYVLGIAMTYSLLGVVAASTGSLFGAALSNVYVVSALALVFVAMGLSMFGLFEVQAPAFIRNRLGGSSQEGTSGYLGIFGTGLVAGVIASPCIGPVLVGVLAYIAQTQNHVFGFLLLFSFAMGMGILFLVLGLSGSLLARMPKAGSWMESVKYLFGAVMIGMAFYYIHPIYPPWLFLALLGAAGVTLASFYGAFESNSQLTPIGRLRKGSMLATFFIGVAFLASGLLARAGVITLGSPISLGPTVNASVPKLDWQPFSPSALNEALKRGQPVIVDFTADWCGACKELEAYTFPDPRVRDLSAKFALFQVDATVETAEVKPHLARFGVVGLPTLIFYDVKGNLRQDLTLTGFENADSFHKRMQSAMNVSGEVSTSP
jgi:thioredoxin:protein disulfide reductase